MPRLSPEEELAALRQRQTDIKADINAKRQRLKALEQEKQQDLATRMRRVHVRLNRAARRRRTRQLILLGSYLEHQMQADPARDAQVRAGLETFLTRPYDRAAFDLPPKEDAK